MDGMSQLIYKAVELVPNAIISQLIET